MNKPVKRVHEYYDYNECRNYLEEKYGYDERDYANKLTARGIGSKADDDSVPYQDFWHYICDCTDIYNGCDFTMYSDWMDDAEDWQKEILQHYFDEFGDENGEIEFNVLW